MPSGPRDASNLPELMQVPAVYCPFGDVWGSHSTYERRDEALSVRHNPKAPTEEVFVVSPTQQQARHLVQSLVTGRVTHSLWKEPWTGSWLILRDRSEGTPELITGYLPWSSDRTGDTITYPPGWYVEEYTLHAIAHAFYATRGKTGAAAASAFPVEVSIGMEGYQLHSWPWNVPKVAQVSFARITRDRNVLLSLIGFKRFRGSARIEIPLSAFVAAARETPESKEADKRMTIESLFFQHGWTRERAEAEYRRYGHDIPVGAIRVASYDPGASAPSAYIDRDGVSKVLVAWDRFVEMGLLGKRRV